jgi:hypothetical protein
MGKAKNKKNPLGLFYIDGKWISDRNYRKVIRERRIEIENPS